MKGFRHNQIALVPRKYGKTEKSVFLTNYTVFRAEDNFQGGSKGK